MRLAISSLSRLAAQFLHELAAGAHELVDRLDHVHRNADGAGLIGDGAGDGLANPPSRVGGKLVAAAPLEFVDGLHQADVAFLNQVEELQAAVGIFLRDGNDQAKVGFDQFFLGLLGFRFAAKDHLKRALQLGGADFAGDLRFRSSSCAAGAEFFARFGLDVAFGGVDAALELAGFALERNERARRCWRILSIRRFFSNGLKSMSRTRCDISTRVRATSHSARADRGASSTCGTCSSFAACFSASVVELGDFVDVLERLLWSCSRSFLR